MTLAPVIEQVATGLNITSATVGLLAGIPVFCFAFTVPLASWVMRRAGLEAAVTISRLAVLLGTVIRSLDGPASAFAGMAVIGLGITIGNITVPVIIGRDFPNSVSSVSGMYTAALNMGAIITTLGTAPLAQVFGWRWAIACWGVLAILALIIWRKVTTRLMHGSSQPSIEVKPAAIGRIWGRWDAWALAIGFGSQSFSYYGITAWLPTLLAQGFGYVLAAIGPYTLGSINVWSGSWTAPLLTTLGALTLMGATILLVASAGPYRPLRPTATE